MKSLKKTLVLLVVLSMIFSTLVPAFAATDVADLDCEDAVLRMEALDIIAGYKDGTFKPENTITRAEMAVIICKMTGITEAAAEASQNVPSTFSDVKVGEWYTGYINIANGNGIIAGFPDGTFRPNEVLTLNQVLTLCVKALGRGAYVDQMGTWPANYVTEAAKLGLLDDVKANSTDANRGNVAIIAWNTLQAKLWDVSQTKLDGEVALGNTNNTLLNTHFRVFCSEGDLKEVESATVASVPSTEAKIGDRQIRLNIADADYDFNAMKVFEIAPKKNDEEATYQDDSKNTTSNGVTYVNEVVAYVPVEVHEDLENLLGRKVTVVFGDDNVVALIIVEDDVVNNEYATKFDGEKLTIGEATYRFADKFELHVNNTPVLAEADEADLETELNNILRGTYSSSKVFEKKIKANVVLNSKGKVTRLDLFVSGNYPEYCTYETIVGDIDETVIYDIDEATKLYDYDEDEIDEDDIAKVYVNGEKASIEDIAVGDVLTIYYKDVKPAGAGEDYEVEYNKNEATTIYASRETVEGTVSRIKNVKDIVIDGTTYIPSAVEAKNVLLLDEADFGDAEVIGETNTSDKFRNLVDETATLYTNIYGEYVLIASEASGLDYTFGILKSVKTPELDDTEYTQKLYIYADDKTTDYILVYDEEEHKNDNLVADPTDTLIDAAVGTPIAFIANADKEIDIEDIEIITEDFGKYIVVNTADNNIDYDTVYFDEERIKLTDQVSGENSKAGIYRFKSSSKILNAKVVNGVAKPETLTWKGLVDDTNPAKVHGNENIIIVCDENDSKIISYIFVDMEEPAVSGTDYAVVTKRTEADNDTTYAYLMDSEGTEIADLEDENGVSNALVNYIVEYKTSGNKLSEIYPLLDVDTIIGLEATDTVKGLYANEGTVKVLGEYTEANDNEVTTKVCVDCRKGDKHDADCEVYLAKNAVTDKVCATCGRNDYHAADEDCYADITVADGEKTVCGVCYQAENHTAQCTVFTAKNAVAEGEKTVCSKCHVENGENHTTDNGCTGQGTVTADACGTCFGTLTHTAECTVFTAKNAVADGEKTVCEVCHEEDNHTAECTVFTAKNAVADEEKTVCATCGNTDYHAADKNCAADNTVASGEKTVCATCGNTDNHATTCDSYVADTVATLKAFTVESIDNTLITYKNANPITLEAISVPKDKAEVTVFNVDDNGNVTVISYSDIEEGDTVIAFGANDEATLLVVIE